MVSLAQRVHSGSGEDTLYTEPVAHSSASDSQILLEPVVGDRPKAVGSLCTGIVAVLHLTLTIGIGIVIAILSLVWPINDERKCESYFITLYLNVLHWAVSFIFDFYLRRKHEESRVEGYLEFYKEIITLARAPYYVATIWNAILLALAGTFHQLYGDMNGHCSGNLPNPLHFVSSLVLIEVCIISYLLVSYIVKVAMFNNRRTCPDALRDEWMASFIRESYSGGEIGLREKDNHTENLLEKQADLLRYLKEQNARLVQKVMILSLQLQEKHGASIT